MFFAQPPAVAAAPAQATDQSDVIEVTGRRSDQALKIDRRTYRVQQTPHSRQKDAIQLLRGLPAVTVSPDDQINLLGSTDVRIFIDGRPYTGDNVTDFLRTLHGSDVERIEIITNPSAQYGAEGTAGIINFVLRKKQTQGVTGTVSNEVTSTGNDRADGSLKYKNGKWTYELEAEGSGGSSGRSRYHKRRSVETAPGGPPTVNTEIGGGPSRNTSGFLSGKMSYDVDPRTTVSVKLGGGAGTGRSIGNAKFAGMTSGFQSFFERQRFSNSSDFLISELNFDHKGRKQGETLNASLSFFAQPHENEANRASFSDGAALSTDKFKRFLFATGQLDWQHPMANGQILSLGGKWNYSRMTERYRFASIGTGGSLGPNTFDQFSGIDDNLAAYATFQQPIGDWTLMPGFRIEHDSRHISSPAHPDVEIRRTDLFPTLHAEHALGKALDLTLSYSKRIDRPQLNDLRPYPLVQDVLTIKEGNPHLQNQSTDAYEIDLHYHHNKVDAGMIVYDRETRRLWSQAYSVSDGVSIFTLINAGHRSDRGAELDIGMPLVGRVKFNGTLNLFDERVPPGMLVGAKDLNSLRYTSNSTLEWDGPDRGGRPGDVAQLQWLYNSETRAFEVSSLAWNLVSLSYTHSFSHTLSITATADYATSIRHRVSAPLVEEFDASHFPAQFRVKLQKSFGKN